MKDEEKAEEILDCVNCKKQLFIGAVKCPPTCADFNDLMKMARWKNEKLDKMRRLADEMYFRMQTLSTDLRPLRKAMEDYHNFIIHEYYE